MISQGVHASSSGGRTIELRQLLQGVSAKFGLHLVLGACRLTMQWTANMHSGTARQP
jgi:hypothetical protein